MVEHAGKHKTLLDEFLRGHNVWKLASHADAFVRRSVFKLLVTALMNLRGSLDMKVIGDSVLSASLHVDQLGSAFDFAKALALLTENCPEIWTKYFAGSGKKSAGRRLCQFLKRGSQGSAPEYWSHVSHLLQQVPETLLDASGNDATSKQSDGGLSLYFPVLDAVLAGLNTKDEPRANQSMAWKTYLEVADRVQQRLNGDESIRVIYKNYLLPIIQEFVSPSSELAGWAVPKTDQLRICVKSFLDIWRGAEAFMRDAWYKLAHKIIENIRVSLPEQSKDYHKSQRANAEESSRWYQLQAAVMNADTSENIKLFLSQTSKPAVQAAIMSVRARNGKPYGASMALVATLKLSPELVNNDAELKQTLIEFVRKDVPQLFLSPSATHLITLLNLLRNDADADGIYRSGLIAIREAPESNTKLSTLETILRSDSINLADDYLLQEVVGPYLESALVGDSSGWIIVHAAICNPAISAGYVHQILSVMVDAISAPEKCSAGLHGLQLLIEKNCYSLELLSKYSDVSRLLARLLSLTTSADEAIAQDAGSISAFLDEHLSRGKSSDEASKSRLDLIRKSLDPPTGASLS